MATNTSAPADAVSSDQLGLPTVARLYYTGYGSRRYKRASVRSGPGEPLTFVSLADERVRRAVAAERERCAGLCKQVADETRNSNDVRAAGRMLAKWISSGNPNDPLPCTTIEPPAGSASIGDLG